jgi:hypothetical protein
MSKLAQRFLESAITLSSFSGIALPAGAFQDESRPVEKAASAAGLSQAPKVSPIFFKPIDRNAIQLSGVSFKQTLPSFQANGQAEKIHRSINADIQSGRPVSAASLKALFVAFSRENISGLTESFFESYAKKFNSADATKIMIESIIPEEAGKRTLPRGPETTPRLAALRVLGNSFPAGTSIEDRRAFFESRRDDADLNIRALSLMLCVNANINPKASYLPSEIVRANQQLGQPNRLRGDEFRLATLFRDALEKSTPDFGVDARTLNQIKIPLLRRAMTIERRNPGITEALLSISENAYVSFLSEHAALIQGARDDLADEVLLGGGENLYAVLHSGPSFHSGAMEDFAKAFRSKFDTKTDVVRGEADPRSPVGENRFFKMLELVAREQGNRVAISSHGHEEGIFFWAGEAESLAKASANGEEPLSTEYISPEEEAGQWLKEGVAPNTWIIQSTCQGFDYGQRVYEIMIEEWLKKMPVDQVVAEKIVPGRIIAAQRGMRSVGLIVEWLDENLPKDKQEPKKTHYSLLFFAIMGYCQAVAEGKDESELESIGPIDKPFKCTFGDLYKIDEKLSRNFEETFGKWWKDREGELHTGGNTSTIDPSLQAWRLINIDRVHKEVIKKLEDKGYQLPEFKSKVDPIKRPGDLIHEIGSVRSGLNLRATVFLREKIAGDLLIA